ncbi:MAG: GGDEF domain-containing response regulator [Mycobacteriales bacterium]
MLPHPGEVAPGPRLLLVEDRRLDARLIDAHLRAEAHGSYALEHVLRLSAAQEFLRAEEVDCILLDLSLPDADRLEALSALQTNHPDVPIIVLSGFEETVLGAQAVQAGAQDYLNKSEVDGRQLWRAIRYAVERKRAELQLRFHALHCSLTGLPNRVLFIDRLEVALARLSRKPGLVAVLFLDLDGFKWVNDSLGHDAGDQVIVEVARRLDVVLRDYDTAARHGGDEFLILTETEHGAEDVSLLAERIRTSLATPVQVAGTDVHITASIGVTYTDSPSASAAGLLRDADAAMYRAKRTGKDRLAFFDESMRQEADRRLQLLNQLHRASELNEFTVVYQPIVDLRTGGLHGWEALLRWRRPDGELVSPAEFIELLEEHGLIVSVGDFVLAQATRWLAERHRAAGPGPLPTVSINLSAVQLTRPGIVQRISDIVAASGVSPEHVCLELTESQVIVDDSAVSARLLGLKELGLSLAMDDYGTGYSTLLQLRRLPFDVLKVDRSFVAGLGEVDADAQIVQAIVAMGTSLGLTVVGEGVETAEQAALLSRYGCQLGQGFLFGHPSEDGRAGLAHAAASGGD